MTRSTTAILQFCGKMLAAYVAWYVLYDLWLLPDGRLDAWVSRSVTDLSAGLLSSLLGFDATAQERIVSLAGTTGIRIVNGCNGLTTIGLFIGFVVAYPGRFWRRCAFIPVGIAVIYATNVGRIVVMVLAQKYWPAALGPIHGFGLTTIFYVVVFGLWVLWANCGGASSSAPATPPSEDTVDPAVA